MRIFRAGAGRASTDVSRRVSTVVLGLALAGCGGTGADGVAGGRAPDIFSVTFETTQGAFVIEFERALSPLAVDRAYELAELSFWEGARVYRVNERYAQFGYSGRPDLDARWIPAGVPDERSMASNVRGTVSFARGGPGTRSAILFVNRGDNTNLDDLDWNGVVGFPPVGRVVSGMDVIDRLNDVYGDDTLMWEDSIAAEGNAFLDRRFPGLDSITSVRVAAAP